MNLRKRFSDAWWRLRHDETGAVCVGCGLEVVDGLLQVDRAAGGGIECGADGLYVSTSVLDPISPDACNGITRRGNGLYSSCPGTVALGVITTTPQQGDLPIDQTAVSASDDEYNFLSDTITITNPYCCPIVGRISVQAGGLYIDMLSGFRGNARLMVDPGTGFIETNPPTNKRVQNNGTGLFYDDLNNMRDDNYIAIPAGPGTTHTYQAKYVFLAETGPFLLHGTIKFEFVYHLTQLCCA